ncbi:MAG: hypothetical protein NXI32_04885 [bacterium]|nr:hypothetical protein [bacterium]
MKTHREMYPSQYTHKLCGKKVRYKQDHNTQGHVERVVPTRFGPLAILKEIGDATAFAIWQLEVIEAGE